MVVGERLHTFLGKANEATRIFCLLALRRLVQLDWIPVRIFNLELTTAWARFHLVAEWDLAPPELGDPRIEVVDVHQNAVPTARLLLAAVGQRARARAPRSAQDQAELVERHAGERLADFGLEGEAQPLRVKSDQRSMSVT